MNGSRRLRLTDDRRRRLAVKGHVLGRRHLAAVAGLVTPDTILRWYRRLVATKYDGSQTRRPGRPATKPDIAALMVRMAHENPTLYSIRPESQVRREDPSKPHQNLGDELTAPQEKVIGTDTLKCRERLGGVLKFYYREAA